MYFFLSLSFLSTFQVGLKKREYCARAKMICSPEANGFNDGADDMDLDVEEK